MGKKQQKQNKKQAKKQKRKPKQKQNATAELDVANMQPNGEADGETEEALGGVAGPEGTGTVVQVEGGSSGAFENPLAQDESAKKKGKKGKQGKTNGKTKGKGSKGNSEPKGGTQNPM